MDETVLCALLRALDDAGYEFVTITPASHARVLDRMGPRVAHDLREIFGWSLPFRRDLLAPDLFELLLAAGIVVPAADLFRSTLRASRVEGRLFLHSAFPTEAADAVFLGPDTYRFIRFAAAESGDRRPRSIADIGAGAGVGGILAALGTRAEVTLTDINPKALALARANASHSDVVVDTVETGGLPDDGRMFDLILANPPFIMDPKGRDYRDGGDLHGAGTSRDWALEGAARLSPGGRMLLYTGVALVGGRDRLREVLAAELPKRGCSLRYAELDPDIFGEELANPAYADVDRIAAVGAVIDRD